MTRLRDWAKVSRSKNAGPFQLTFDIMFDTADAYFRVVSSGIVCEQLFSDLYGVMASQVHLVNYEAGLAIKATIPRSVVSGDVLDTDVYGGQQYGPLVDINIPDA